MVLKNNSKKVITGIDELAIFALKKLKRHLASEMDLTQPDHSKDFVLTSESSSRLCALTKK